jgi:hypothetical protein
MKMKKTMLLLNAILKEMKDIPAERMEELYQYVHSLSSNTKQTEKVRKKILSFSGAFSDMSEEDYIDFLLQTKKVRTNLFDRNIEL